MGWPHVSLVEELSVVVEEFTQTFNLYNFRKSHWVQFRLVLTACGVRNLSNAVI